jgi:hypothetical protein
VAAPNLLAFKLQQPASCVRIPTADCGELGGIRISDRAAWNVCNSLGTFSGPSPCMWTDLAFPARDNPTGKEPSLGTS